MSRKVSLKNITEPKLVYKLLEYVLVASGYTCSFLPGDDLGDLETKDVVFYNDNTECDVTYLVNKDGDQTIIRDHSDLYVIKEDPPNFYFNYNGYFTLHLVAPNRDYINIACNAIDILVTLQDLGLKINDKSVYLAIYNCFANIEK